MAAKQKGKRTAEVEVEVITAPEYGGRDGLVLINGNHYLVHCWGDGPGAGWRVQRLTAEAEAAPYDLHTSPYGHLVCDCPDATYRERLCKHCKAINRLHVDGLL